MNIKHIIEGISNSIFVKEEVEKIANERYTICSTCPKSSMIVKQQLEMGITSMPGPYYSSIRPDEHCTMCACNLHAKDRSLHTNCPINKWKAVATTEEAAKIAMITENEK